MNENAQTIRLVDLMHGEDGWGREEGAAVGDQLMALVASAPGATVVCVSLAGIRRTDASFPRESVVDVAKRWRKDKVFCLTDVANEDLLDNWEAAAQKKEQPLLVWTAGTVRVIGPRMTEGLRPLFEAVAYRGSATVSEVASSIGLNVPNASNQLRKLWEAGYLLRRERAAPSGGIEYEYVAAK